MQALWFVHLDPEGQTGCGSERNRPCYRSRRDDQVEIARNIQRENGGGSVYLFPGIFWTQRVCEMDAKQMGDYVRSHGALLVGG